MGIQMVAQKFVELCRQDKNFDVMSTLYAPGIVSIEGGWQANRRPAAGDQVI
jgi:hypothetical protein